LKLRKVHKNELRAYEKETRRELIRYMKLVRSMHEKIESESNKPKNLKKKKKTKKSKKTKKKRKVTKKDEGSKAKKPKKGKKKKVKKKKKHSEKKDEIVLQTKIESTDSFVEFGDVSETEPKPGNLIRKLSYDNSKDILRLLESNPNNKALLDNNPQNE
jgi:DNA primase catalytic subunit